MTGGGCAIALVEQARADEIRSVVSEGYEAATGFRAEIFLTVASNGAAPV
jgi:galactokinase